MSLSGEPEQHIGKCAGEPTDGRIAPAHVGFVCYFTIPPEAAVADLAFRMAIDHGSSKKDSLLGEEWRDIAPFLDSALDVDPQQRERWLADLASTNAEVAGKLRVLLAELAAADADGFLKQPPAFEGDLGSAAPSSMAGKRLGAYSIEHLLGRGGMGEVWLASRSDGRFEGRIAIKLIDSEVAHAKLAERFRREGRLLAHLAHPNIARLIDAGTTDDGRQYLALEYVEGERIDRHCDHHQLGVEARVKLFLDVISAVAHAHAKLIIHRDLKPQNVFVARDGTVKLLDFGIAKLIGGADSEEGDGVTRLEEAVMTPEYAAPEQLLGELPSTATDVYQLGMLLYVVLTGAHPVPGAGSRSQRIQAALDGHIARASDSAPAAVRKVLRGDLDAILATALRKDPADRYPTAQALKDDLARWLNREPVSARRGNALYRVRKFVAKHRIAVVAASVAIVGLCGTSVLAVQQARESDRQRERAEFEKKRVFARLRFNTLMMSAIGDPSRPISAEQMLEHGVELLEKEYANDPDFVIDELIHISGRYMDWDNRKGEYDVLAKAEAIARRTGSSLQLARVQCNMVETEIAFDRIDRAAARLAEGQAALAAAQDANAGDESDCLRASANVKDAQGRTRDAAGDLQRAVELLEQNDMTSNVRYAPLLDYLGSMYQSLGDFRRSYEYTHRSRLAKEAAGFGGTAGWNGALHNEAAALRDMGEIRAAVAQEADVIKRDLTQSPNDPLPVAESLVYAGMLFRIGRLDEALQWFDRALADAQAADSLTSALNAKVGRARIFISWQQFDRASATLDEVDREPDLHSEQLRNQYIRTRMARAELLIAQGQWAQARAIITPALAECRDPGRGMGFYLQSALLLASRASKQDPAEAAKLAQEALQVAESRARDPQHSADVGEATLVLAQARLAQNDLPAAGAAAHRAETILTDAVGKEHSLTKAAAVIAAGISKP